MNSMWDRGDYATLADRLAPAAEGLVSAAGDGAGRRALDVAAGTGNVAARLAHRGWRVTATDGAPGLVGRGSAAAQAQGLDVAWAVADLAEQPVASGSQALVASSFGLIFAADPAVVLEEARRVLEPGGRLLLTVWPDDGFMTTMATTMARFLPAPAGGPDPGAWGSASGLRQLLGRRFADVTLEERSLPFAFPSPAAARHWLEATSPAHIAARATAGADGEALMDAVEDLFAAHRLDDGSVRVPVEFRLVSAARA